MTQFGSYATFGISRLPMLQSESSDLALQTHMKLVSGDIAFRFPLSQFSFANPNSNVTAARGSLGHNINSTASAMWLKQVGSGNTGWVPLG